MRLNQLLDAIGRTASFSDGGTDGAANDTTRGPAVVPTGTRPTQRLSRLHSRARNSIREGHQRRTASAFNLAAQRYDPERIEQHELRDLGDLLYQHNAISARDRLILHTDPTGGRMAVARDLAGPRNALVDWQDRRIHDMTNGRVNAVEAGSRALSILGRISTLRRESGQS